MDIYLLDACAVMAFLKKEPGYQVVRSTLISAGANQCTVYLHAANLYEVYYQYLRDDGLQVASAAWQDALSLPVELRYDFDEAFLKQAAEFKARHKMSVTDSFLLAQATRLDASVITSDHHEFDAVEQAGLCRFAWMR